jgi:hypothetical protein
MNSLPWQFRWNIYMLPEKYARLEKEYNKSIERKIRRELP